MDVALVHALTKREREVLALIAEGYSAAEIAERLHRSPKTIQTHRQALGRKLHVSNRVELTRMAIAAGLVPVPDEDSDGAPEYLSELHQRASAGSRVQEALRCIDLGVNMMVGEEFFCSFVNCLVSALSIDIAVVARVDEADGGALEILACSCDEAPESCRAQHNGVPSCRHLLKHSLGEDQSSTDTCGDVSCSHACGLHLLTIPLQNSAGRCVGVLAIRHTEPLRDDLMAEYILRIMASRAVAEIERIQMERELHRRKDALEEEITQRTTQLSQAVEDHRNAEQKLRTSYDNVPVGLFRTSLDGSVISANHTLVQILEFDSLEQLLSINVSNYYVNPDERQSIVEHVRKHGMVEDYKLAVRTRHGEIVWVVLTLQAKNDADGQLAYMDGTMRLYVDDDHKRSESMGLHATG